MAHHTERIEKLRERIENLSLSFSTESVSFTPISHYFDLLNV